MKALDFKGERKPLEGFERKSDMTGCSFRGAEPAQWGASIAAGRWVGGALVIWARGGTGLAGWQCRGGERTL